MNISVVLVVFSKLSRRLGCSILSLNNSQITLEVVNLSFTYSVPKIDHYVYLFLDLCSTACPRKRTVMTLIVIYGSNYARRFWDFGSPNFEFSLLLYFNLIVAACPTEN